MDLVIGDRTIDISAEDYEILRHEILRDANTHRRAAKNVYRRSSYYNNIDKEREWARARYYTKRGLPVPPRKE